MTVKPNGKDRQESGLHYPLEFIEYIAFFYNQ